ncbi:MAG: KTSC domain-containing protein [Clostridiaceae bacterium]
MNLIPVSSSRMRAVGYENSKMYIQFNDGSIYVYENVSVSQYQDFINSPSLGSALHGFDKIHPYHRL